MVSSSSETIIFIFLGLSTVTAEHHWDTVFVLAVVCCCLLYRAIAVLTLSSILTYFRYVNLDPVDVFILAYGGLRGAVAYGLVVTLPEEIKAKHMFITATIVVIFVTVFIQGTTIKPLVNLLHVERQEKCEKTVCQHVTGRVLNHALAAIEDICGVHGSNHWRDKFDTFNTTYIKPLLLREDVRGENHHEIWNAAVRIATKEAIKHIHTNPTLPHKLSHTPSKLVL